jgi:hypothetical protein
MNRDQSVQDDALVGERSPQSGWPQGTLSYRQGCAVVTPREVRLDLVVTAAAAEAMLRAMVAKRETE